MGAILSFLGGGAFRMIWGEISHYVTQAQDQKMELARMELQEKLDASAHQRNLEALRLQAGLGIKEIEARSDADTKLEELKAWAVAVTDVSKQTGISNTPPALKQFDYFKGRNSQKISGTAKAANVFQYFFRKFAIGCFL